MTDALIHLDNVIVHEGDVTSYVEVLIANTRALEGLTEQLRFCFDYTALARDMRYNVTTYAVIDC